MSRDKTTLTIDYYFFLVASVSTRLHLAAFIHSYIQLYLRAFSPRLVKILFPIYLTYLTRRGRRDLRKYECHGRIYLCLEKRIT